MVSRDHESAMYRQIARSLREQIRSGQLAAGTPVGPEKKLAYEYGVSTATIGEALRVLRDEGWLEPAASGQVARVAEPPEKRVQPIQRKTRISGRPATSEEARDMALRPGAQIFVVTHRGREHKFPQDQVDLTVD